MNQNNPLPKGAYQWVPPVPANGLATAGSTAGFNFLSIVRGTFRNDVPKDTPNDSRTYATITTSYSGTVNGVSDKNDISRNYPFWAAFRRKRRPSWKVATPPVGVNFTMTADDNGVLEYKIDLGSNQNISAMTMEYTLVVDPNFPYWKDLLADADDTNNANDQQNFASGNVTAVNWTQYHPMQIVGIPDGSNTATEYPLLVKNKYQALAITGVKGSGFENLTNMQQNPANGTQLYAPGGTFTFNLGAPTSFPNIRYIIIRQRNPEYQNLTLSINRILLFNNSRVNMADKQYPAQAFGYQADLEASVYIDGSSSGGIYPNLEPGRPLIYFKIFSPEDLNASIGFAHAIDVRFLLVWFPMLSQAGATAYMAINAGPLPGLKQLAYSMNATLDNTNINPIYGYAVNLDADKLVNDIISFDIQRGTGTTTTPPTTWSELPQPNNPVSESDTNYQFNGPMVSRYLYLDTLPFNGKTLNDTFQTKTPMWYRINQTYSLGSASGSRLSPAFQPSRYSEGSPMQMAPGSEVGNLPTTVIARRIKDYVLSDPTQVMNSSPVAIFIADDPNPPAGSATFTSGVFNFSFAAHTDDANNVAETYLVARFWFHPVGVTFNAQNPHQYRSVSELIFITNSAGEQVISRQNPADVSQLMISPALGTDDANYSINKYITSAQGTGVSNNVWTFPSSFSQPGNTYNQGRLVIGLYIVTVPNPGDTTLNSVNSATSSDSSPKVYITVDPTRMSVTTTIGQTITGNLFPTQPNLFGTANYESVPEPLYLNATTLAGATLNATNNWYIYNNSVATPTVNSPDTALNNLMIMTSTNNNIQVAIPYKSVPLTFSSNTRVYADFVTNNLVLTDGKITNGTWTFSFTADQGADTGSISYKYQFEAFLCTADGVLINYILKSPIQDSASYTVDLTLPYAIESNNVQMVVRVSGYPYSTNGTPIDLSVIQTELGSKPVGLRITKFTVSAHTLTTMDVSQTDSLLLSIASFEGLPMVPSVTFGGENFWVDLDPDMNQQVVVTSIGPMLLSATLFSPTWLVNLPQGCEIEYNSSVYTGDVAIRTAIGSSSTNDTTVTAGYNTDSQQIHVAHSVEQSAITASTLVQTGKVIQLINMNNPNLQATSTVNNSGAAISKLSNQFVSGYRLATGGGYSPYQLQGDNPSIVLNNGNKYIQIVTEVDEVTGPSSSIVRNRNLGNVNSWDNNSPIAAGQFGDIARVAIDLQYPTVVDLNNGFFCIIGWLDSGFAAAKFVSPYTSNPQGIVPQGIQLIIDGNGTTPPNWVFTKGAMNIPVVQTPLGCALGSSQNIMVVYPLLGNNGILYCKELQGMQSVKPSREIVSFPKIINNNSDSLAIRCPSVVYDDLSGTYICAFWCSGKIFITRFFDFIDTSLNQLTLVAGNNDFTKTTNPGNAFFSVANKNSYIVNNVTSPDVSDVLSQRVGITITPNLQDKKNSIFVFYKNNLDQVFCREVRLGISVGAAIQIN